MQIKHKMISVFLNDLVFFIMLPYVMDVKWKMAGTE